MDSQRHIRSIEWARLEGRRPRHAGSNARLGDHGIVVRPPIARITLDDGSSGFGFCAASREAASAILGLPLDALYSPESGITEAGQPFEYPLLDLAGNIARKPVYEIVAAQAGKKVAHPLQVPCYDTSLYFDDLRLESHEDAAYLIATEARDGFMRGHRAFKIKVGRGARHMDLEEGTRRDIAIVKAVREAVGSGVPIMLDANNGYNLNLTKRVIAETAEYGIFWMEEAFHEDRILYTDLREWQQQQGYHVLIADGEGQASPTLLDWAKEGVVDVIQYDIFSYGFTRWLATGKQLDAWGVHSAPHHYGGFYGNFVASHLACTIERFTYVEWDEATVPGIETSGYSVHEGHVHVPESPGFGLHLDSHVFEHALHNNGYRISI